MEEQRQRQEEETKKESTDTAMETGTEDAAPAATNEDNLLMNAMQSLGVRFYIILCLLMATLLSV